AVFIQEVFQDSGISKSELDAVAVGGGPGSYTGLRIGTSTAKGLCYALDKPLLSVPTLLGMASGALLNIVSDHGNALMCPMIDARRMEVYSAIYDSSLHEKINVDSVIVDEKSFFDVMDESVVWFFGDGMHKCKHLLSAHPNARFIDDFVHSSSYLYGPASVSWKEGRTEHIGLYEPFYFKEFVAGKGSVSPRN
ncbi:MAG: tRNA (adenosine(37)-N6)-threonylcarbamoyltransferase complex dimerization subunit type 1 TsaB, partial [Bacteroidota bacterium]